MTRKKILTKIDSLAFEGKGIARIEGKVIFVPNALPGDLLEIEITKSKKNYSEGRILRIVEPSPFRITPKCEHFGTCGGCSFQNLTYEQQLHWKENFIVDAFKKIGKTDNIPIKPILPSPKIYEYRNKMEFSFGNSRWLEMDEIQSGAEIPLNDKHFALGFHIPKRFDKVLDIKYCYLQDYRGNIILKELKSKASKLEVPAYNLKTHKGFLRNLILRWSSSNNDLMVNLVTTSQLGENEKSFLKWFNEDFSTSEVIQHLIHTTNDSYSPTNFGQYKVIKGVGYLYEELLGVKFRISPFSFFQVNILQAKNLAEEVIEFAQLDDKVVWDLYSGSGLFSLIAANKARYVIGLELNQEAVQDGRYNANLNNLNNVEFIAMDLHSKKIIFDLEKLPKPEIIIIDPPRTGIHKNILKSLLQLLPEKIVYVSCNPTTMARDYLELQKHYEINILQPIDMFPQTYHIENVALLVKRKSCYGNI